MRVFVPKVEEVIVGQTIGIHI